MPYWRLENFDRFFPRISSVAKRVNEFHIAYISGYPRTEWEGVCIFHKLQLSPTINKNIIFKWIFRSDITKWIFSRRFLCKQVKNINVDLYWGLSDWWTQEFCYECSKIMNKPYIIDLRGDYKKEAEVKKIPWIKRFLSNYRKIESLKKASLIIPISNKMKSAAIEWGINKNKIYDIMTLGLDTNMFKPIYVEKNKKLTCGFAGRLSQEKGTDELIQIMKLLPEVDFLVAGETQIKIDFPENCKYLGRLPYEEMPLFYNKVDAVIVPSKFESFGFVFLETYACGKPLITSKSVHPPNLPIYGFALEKPTITNYVKCIKQIRSVVSLRKSNEIRRYIEKTYSWDNYGEKMINIFGGIMLQHRAERSKSKICSIPTDMGQGREV